MKLFSSAILFFVLQSSIMIAQGENRLTYLFDQSMHPFYYGVASGDPTHESVLIWTKVYTPLTETKLSWQISEDESFKNIIQEGDALALAENNHSVMVEVSGLKSRQTYFYRFIHEGKASITGRCKTLPTGEVNRLKLLVMSCANLEAGYFNAYRVGAQMDDVDAVLHLGDYIYEYPAGKYGRNMPDRKHLPEHEIVHLDDYRTRFAQYRLDKDLQYLHARHSFITIWDDHESANDAWKNGAQNHQPETEGEWNERKQAAIRAYYEWLPVRKNNGKLYRTFSFGNLADLWMLEERHEARSQQAKDLNDPTYADTQREMLGSEQMQWLAEGFRNSEARWKILGNQVILSSIDASKILPENPKFMDMWDGYPAERNRLFDILEKHNNTIVVSGDSHTSWAFDLTRNPEKQWSYDRKNGKGIIGAEFATPSVTSANFDEYVKRWKAKIGARRFLKDHNNPHARFCNVTEHGFMLLTLTEQNARADWYFVKSLDKKSLKHKRSASYFYDGKKVRKA